MNLDKDLNKPFLIDGFFYFIFLISLKASKLINIICKKNYCIIYINKY
ncbi:hypothetical protein M33023_00910 [Candidatus Phytoplasma asteris]|uniref:Uncharacterized protein n=1 Tax=Candidatus Phytoplasma asteris TaxID=85620 RepID=A0ABZ2YG68_9MOLU